MVQSNLRRVEVAQDIYLIWSHEHAAWWGPGGCGYTRRVSEAGRYSHGQALDLCERALPGTSTRLGAIPELPVRLADVTMLVSRYQAAHPLREEPWL